MILSANVYSRWKFGPPKDASFFPVAVWLQLPLCRRHA